MTEAQVQDIDVDLIDSSPRNPRKLFDKEKTQKLADSITTIGLLQPVGLVAVGKRFRLVFGERRWRASVLAKQKTIRAFVSELTPEVEDVQRHIENEQGEQLTPLERALGYAELMHRHKLTVEQVAEKVHKSPATVRDLLKLNRLIEPAKAALLDIEGKLDGAFTASHGLWVAHVPTSLQKEVLEAVLGDEHGGVMSVRATKEMIRREYMLRLKDAHFDPTDAYLVPKAGTCGLCPWKDGDDCTNTPCFREKDEAWLKNQEKAGRKVLSEKEASKVFSRHGGDHIEYDAEYVAGDRKEYGAKKTAAEKVKPEDHVLALAPSGRVVTLVPKAAIPRRDDVDEQRIAPRQKSAAEVKGEHDMEVRRETTQRVLTQMMETRDTRDASTKFHRTLVSSMMHTIHRDGLKAVAKRHGLDEPDGLLVLGMKAVGAELHQLVLEMQLAQTLGGGYFRSHEYDAALTEGCGLMGVDLAKTEKQVRGELSKVWAARAKKKSKTKAAA